MIFLKGRTGRRAIQRCNSGLFAVFALVLGLSLRTAAQTAQKPEVRLAQIMGTVVDVRGDAVAGATVTLTGPQTMDRKTAATSENGFFEFNDVNPGGPYQIAIRAIS